MAISVVMVIVIMVGIGKFGSMVVPLVFMIVMCMRAAAKCS